MPNLYSLGSQLQNSMRKAAASRQVSLRREWDQQAPVIVGPFSASSPPIRHMLMSETGLDISEHERVFYFEAADLQGVQPQIGDLIVDHDDNDSLWRVLPQGDNYAWQWHDQMKTAYQVRCKGV